jgi:hypothetical protein
MEGNNDMKKSLALLLVFSLLLSICTALGENVKTPYDALVSLMQGKSFTLTMRAEDVVGLEDYVNPFGGEITCSLRQEGDTVLLTAASAGEKYLNITADAAGYQVETNLIENGVVSGTWAELGPNVTYKETDGEKAMSIRISTAEHANINFDFSVVGVDVTDYVVDAGFRLMNPDGTFWNIFDTVTATGGEATRESVISIVSPEWAIEGEGEETAEETDGAITLSRREAYLVTLNYDELGTLTFVSTLVISE